MNLDDSTWVIASLPIIDNPHQAVSPCFVTEDLSVPARRRGQWLCPKKRSYNQPYVEIYYFKNPSNLQKEHYVKQRVIFMLKTHDWTNHSFKREKEKKKRPCCDKKLITTKKLVATLIIQISIMCHEKEFSRSQNGPRSQIIQWSPEWAVPTCRWNSNNFKDHDNKSYYDQKPTWHHNDYPPRT